VLTGLRNSTTVFTAQVLPVQRISDAPVDMEESKCCAGCFPRNSKLRDRRYQVYLIFITPAHWRLHDDVAGLEIAPVVITASPIDSTIFRHLRKFWPPLV